MKPQAIRTFGLVQDVSHFLEGGIDDWPASVSDAIMGALERLAVREHIPLAIVLSRCDVDPDKEEHEPGRFFIEVIASEIIAVADDMPNAQQIGRVVKGFKITPDMFDAANAHRLSKQKFPQ